MGLKTWLYTRQKPHHFTNQVIKPTRQTQSPPLFYAPSNQKQYTSSTISIAQFSSHTHNVCSPCHSKSLHFFGVSLHLSELVVAAPAMTLPQAHCNVDDASLRESAAISSFVITMAVEARCTLPDSSKALARKRKEEKRRDEIRKS